MHDASDIPARIELLVPSERECVMLSNTISYEFKFDWFKVISECKKQS